MPASEAEAFMYPYFDDVPDVRYVRVDLVWEGAGVRAALTFDDAAAIPDPVMKARMRHQYGRVDAGGQVADEAIEVIKEEADNIAGEYPGAEPDVIRRAKLTPLAG